MGSLRATVAVLLPAVLAAGCGQDVPVDLVVHGVGVRVESDAPFVRQQDFPVRLEEVIAAALTYWGADWSRLGGRRITLSSGPYVACGDATHATGCTDAEIRVATWDPGVGTVACVEQTVLVHEIGHAVLGDPAHHDPRWMGFDDVASALAGRAGYGAGGGLACDVSAAVWQHPLDSR